VDGSCYLCADPVSSATVREPWLARLDQVAERCQHKV